MTFWFKTRAGQFMAYLTGLTLAGFMVTAGAPANWAVMVPDVAHTYGIRSRRGADLFFAPAVGWFIEHGLWVCVSLVVLAIVAEMIGRRLTPGVEPAAGESSTDIQGLARRPGSFQREGDR